MVGTFSKKIHAPHLGHSKSAPLNHNSRMDHKIGVGAQRPSVMGSIRFTRCCSVANLILLVEPVMATTYTQ